MNVEGEFREMVIRHLSETSAGTCEHCKGSQWALLPYTAPLVGQPGTVAFEDPEDAQTLGTIVFLCCAACGHLKLFRLETLMGQDEKVEEPEADGERIPGLSIEDLAAAAARFTEKG